MSDINEFQPDTPDAPDTGQQGAGGQIGGTAVHLDYVLTYEESEVFFLGETRPLKWSIVCEGGQLVAVPSSASITIVDELGVLVGVSLSPDAEDTSSVLTQTLAADWSPPDVGTYLATFMAVIGTQIRIDEQIIVVI